MFLPRVPKDYLILCFKIAIKNDTSLIGIRININGYDYLDLINNCDKNFEKKMLLYNKTFNHSLIHYKNKQIKVTHFAYCNTLNGLYKRLDY